MKVQNSTKAGGTLGHNPRYVAYANAHGRSPEDQLAHDRVEWPGGSMCGYILWSRARLPEFSKVNPDAFTFGRLIDHESYDAWLAERYPRDVEQGHGA